MSDMDAFTKTLVESTVPRTICKICRVLEELPPAGQDVVRAAIRARTPLGSYLYSAETVARALKAQGLAVIGESSVKRHRRTHEPAD